MKTVVSSDFIRFHQFFWVVKNKIIMIHLFQPHKPKHFFGGSPNVFLNLPFVKACLF